MAQYRCTEDCFHNVHRYRRGDVAEFQDGQTPVHKDGSLAHFVLVDGDVPPPTVPNKPAVKMNEKVKK